MKHCAKSPGRQHEDVLRVADGARTTKHCAKSTGLQHEDALREAA